MKFDSFQRLTLLQVLPQNVGSLEESIVTKEIRSELQFSDDEKEQVDWQTQGQSIQFNPDKMEKVSPVEMNLNEKEREVIAYGFLLDEKEGDVSTDETYVGLLQEFYDEIQDLKE